MGIARLLVGKHAGALHYLQFIGYYRFSAYRLPFQTLAVPDKPFAAGTTFEQVLSLYVFDRELRLLVMDAIERVEVAVRSSMVNHMCLKHGAHWFMNARHFKALPFPSGARMARGFDHSKFLDKIDEELGIRPGAKTTAIRLRTEMVGRSVPAEPLNRLSAHRDGFALRQNWPWRPSQPPATLPSSGLYRWWANPLRQHGIASSSTPPGVPKPTP